MFGAVHRAGSTRVLYGFYQGSVRDVSGFCFRASSKSPECRQQVYLFTAESVRIASATKCFGLTAQFPNKNPHWLADSQEERSQDTRKASDPRAVSCSRITLYVIKRDSLGHRHIPWIPDRAWDGDHLECDADAAITF